MTVPTLRTERLTLCAPQARDARVVTKALNSLNVSRWLAVVPFPYGMTDAAWFINECDRGNFTAWFFWAGDRFVGTIGLDAALGYWLAEDAWGRGYASEAARVVIAHHFETSDAQSVVSDYFVGNAGSLNVLTKLGFEDNGATMTHCKTLNKDVPSRTMILRRDKWDSVQDG